MKFYTTPEIELRRLAAASVFTASGDPDDWETDIIEDGNDTEDPSDAA